MITPRALAILTMAALVALLTLLAWRTADCQLRAVCDAPAFFGFASPDNPRL